MKDQQIQNIFAKRLRQARKMKGMSLEALSEAMKQSVSRQAINKYEQGKMMPDSRVLLSLAASLDVKADYFFRPYTVTIDSIEFRKKSRFSKAKVESLSLRVQEELERYLEVEQTVNATIQFDIKRKKIASTKDAQQLAAEVRDFFRLGQDGISNVVEILEDNGIKVIEVCVEPSFDGLSGYVNGNIPVIVVNSSFSAERKRFTALHELGHLLMEFAPEVNQKEIESLCNAFASELLLPFDALKSKIGNKRHEISLAELKDIQRQFGISIDAIMYSLRQHDVIGEQRYRTYNIKKNTTPSLKEIVEKSRYDEPASGRFVRLVYRALASEVISISKAAALLKTSVENVNAHIQLV